MMRTLKGTDHGAPCQPAKTAARLGLVLTVLFRDGRKRMALTEHLQRLQRFSLLLAHDVSHLLW